MVYRLPDFSDDQINRIHAAAMEILSRVGVAFDEPEALGLFEGEGFQVEGKTVRMTEAQVDRALQTAPGQFTVRARHPEKDLSLGAEGAIFAPGYGAPFIAEADGRQRKALLADYEAFCKLVQTSGVIDMNGFMMVVAQDLAPETAHLEMLLSSMLLCDKPFMGCPESRQGARDTLAMAALLWGDAEPLADSGPVSVSLISSQSPLQFHTEMTGALIELARGGQACVIDSLVMAGSSGPVTLAGALALQNAEILSGVVLSQLIRPGAPVVYGGLSTAMDMRSGGLAVGCPELSQLVAASAALAHFYGLPCRSGGSLTDAHVVDAQAASESALALSTAVRSGVDFILDAAGILGAYMAMSFEKFLIDEEVCGLVRRLTTPLKVSGDPIEDGPIDDDAIDVEMIAQVGIGGQYLTHPETLRRCRSEFYQTDLFGRQNHAGWISAGARRIEETAAEQLERRLAAYEKPEIDPDVETALRAYVADYRRGG